MTRGYRYENSLDEGPEAAQGSQVRWPGKRTRTEMLWRSARGPVAPGADAAVERALEAQGGASLPAETRSRFESSLHTDLGGVRVHRGEASAAAAEAIGARAFTVGKDVHFGAGEYAPGTPAGDHLLAHEVAHAALHSDGALHGSGPVSDPADPAEQQADTAAESMTDSVVDTLRKALAAGGAVLRAALAAIDPAALVDLLPTIPELLQGILDLFWPAGTGAAAQFTVGGGLYLAATDIGIPVDLDVKGEGGLKIWALRVGTKVEFGAEVVATVEGSAAASVKAAKLLGGVTLNDLMRLKMTVNLADLTWPAGALGQLLAGEALASLRTLAASGKAFWDATQFEAKGTIGGAIFGEEKAGLDSAMAETLRIGEKIGCEVTVASRSTSADGKIELRGTADLFAQFNVDLAPDLLSLGNAIKNKLKNNGGSAKLGVGLRAAFVFPKLSEPDAPVRWEVAIQNYAELSASLLGQSGKLTGEAEILLAAPDVPGFVDALVSGKLDAGDVTGLLPVSALVFKLTGKLNLDGVKGITSALGTKLPVIDRAEYGFEALMRFDREILTKLVERSAAAAADVARALAAGDVVGALRLYAQHSVDGPTELVADLIDAFQTLTLTTTETVGVGGDVKTPGMGDVTGIGGKGEASVSELGKWVLGPEDVYLDKVAEVLRGLV